MYVIVSGLVGHMLQIEGIPGFTFFVYIQKNCFPYKQILT